MLRKWASAVLLCGVSAKVSALDISPTLKLGYELGGDKLLTSFLSGDDVDAVGTHDGLAIGGGLSLLSAAKAFELELTGSYKFEQISTRNSDLVWRRYPIDLLMFYRFLGVRAGGGVTYHLAPEISGGGNLNAADAKFDNALGGIVQFDWLTSGVESGSNVSVGLRYTFIKYQLKGGGAEFSSNGAGIHLQYRF